MKMVDNVGVSDALSYAPVESLARREKLINNFARVTQFLTWPILWPVFHIFFDIRTKGHDNFTKIKDPFIIISNHIDFYDSFLFRLALGVFTSHLPLRFMAVTRFQWKFLNALSDWGVIDFIYSLFGVFIVVPGLGMNKNLAEAVEIIRCGGNVVMYPEGQINKDENKIAPFKKGAAVLMQKTGVPIIPMSFRLGAKNIFRRRLYINIGKPITERNNDASDLTTTFFRAVSELHSKG
jgi:1-acyl-sn-glycerol-3-phosphate acyltransferase